MEENNKPAYKGDSMKKFDPKEIGWIDYTYETSVMKIFNLKGLLIFEEVVTEEYFNKAGNKLIAVWGGKNDKE